MDKFAKLVDLIYEAPFVPHLWQDILQNLSDIADARGGVLTTQPIEPNSLFHTDGVLPVFMQMHADNFGTGRSLGKELLHLSEDTFHSDCHVLPEDKKARMPLYRDLLWPLGIGHWAGTHFRTTFGEDMMICLLKACDQGPVTDAQLGLLNELRPHLGRAVLLAARNEFQQVQNANQALCATGLASASVCYTGRIIDCNRLFSSHSDHVVITGHDTLRLVDDQANAMFADCLERSQHRDFDPAQGSRSIVLPATASAPQALLHVIPARGIVQDLFTNASFFVTITPLGAVHAAPMEVIKNLFDLTTAEARIARALAIGNDVKDIAASFGIATETVRRHLKSIYSKTGISRQAELSAVIAGLKVIE